MVNKSDFTYYANDSIILDSGIDKIQLNKDLYNALNQSYFFNCTESKKYGLISCPCSQKFPILSFILDRL